MKSNTRTTTVAGKTYTVWSDFVKRGTFAADEEGNEKQLRGSGYIHNELTVRKAIAIAYNLPTFRK